MDDPFQMQPELRYGAPLCDQILTNRHFSIGYSWYFRQPKWTLEIVNPDRPPVFWKREGESEKSRIKRLDNFRADTRIPKRFRASLNAYKGSNYDRGHLVASANKIDTELQNSETFLLSNMSPQAPRFNRGIWRELEDAIRELDAHKNNLETYVLTCPVFYFGEKIEVIGDQKQSYGIDVPIPHAFIKSVLVETRSGKLKLWTFQMDNKKLSGPPSQSLVNTYDAEQIVGGRFWDRVHGSDLHSQKDKAQKLWRM